MGDNKVDVRTYRRKIKGLRQATIMNLLDGAWVRHEGDPDYPIVSFPELVKMFFNSLEEASIDDFLIALNMLRVDNIIYEPKKGYLQMVDKRS